jgi:hypothetical protein
MLATEHKLMFYVSWNYFTTALTMKGMYMSVNTSHWITAVLTQLLSTRTVEQINREVRNLLNTKTKVRLHIPRQKEIPPPHITGCENWKNACPCPSVVKLSRDNIQIGDTNIHTSPLHTFAKQCLWLTQPPGHKTSQRAALLEPVCTVPQHKAIFCSCWTAPSFWNTNVLRCPALYV